ncbi:MAG: hypothetical protein C4547_03555 [Phycisphaerales bacterium]|nr:MAG: hypothetical protein C4547_03555 [Phycisphaerales bacterium]
MCGLLCIAPLASAEELARDAFGASADATVVAPGPGILAEQCQGNDNESLAPGSVACSPDQGRTVTENGHARQWAGLGATSLAQVRFGVETCRDNAGQGRPCAIEVRAYSAPNFPTFGGAQLLATANMDIPDGTALEIFTADFPNVAIPQGTNLVIELYNPDSFRNQFGFWPGSNAGGQSQPSFIRSTPCGLGNWTNLASINFPNVHLVICWSDEGGGGGGCQYKLTVNSKAKKGCGVCPKKGDIIASGDPCEDIKDCAKKLVIKKLDCPDGGPGFCKKVKGKKDSCV